MMGRRYWVPFVRKRSDLGPTSPAIAVGYDVEVVVVDVEVEVGLVVHEVVEGRRGEQAVDGGVVEVQVEHAAQALQAARRVRPVQRLP
jgi:hypothetical protein